MTSADFSTTTHGKWILAGEHAVIRGHPALVFPIPTKTLTLTYVSTNTPCQAEFSGAYAEGVHLLFWSVLEHGLKQLGHTLDTVHGTFSLTNMIPMGGGLGASAALCSALSQWFCWRQYFSPQHCFNFARSLEDLFHGKSSGVDIAGASATQGILFTQHQQQVIQQQWQPTWYLSFSGHIGITAHCVKQVQTLWHTHPKLAQHIDATMAASVTLATHALDTKPQTGLPQLATAINQAATCFSQWGLIDDAVKHHMHQLQTAGAIATKPTGSGSGGYVLSLWHEPPTAPLDFTLITL